MQTLGCKLAFETTVRNLCALEDKNTSPRIFSFNAHAYEVGHFSMNLHVSTYLYKLRMCQISNFLNNQNTFMNLFLRFRLISGLHYILSEYYDKIIVCWLCLNGHISPKNVGSCPATKRTRQHCQKDTEMEFDMCLYVLIIIQKANWVYLNHSKSKLSLAQLVRFFYGRTCSPRLKS
jgi:hypothetical protein